MRAIISLISAIILMFFVIVLFNFIFRNTTSNRPIVTGDALADYASTDASVSFKTRGRINGDDAHRIIEIIVNNDRRRINLIQGYQGRVIKDQSLPNNTEAFSAFLAALDKAGFTKERDTDFTQQGICPQGRLFNYDLVGTDGKDSHLWSGSCELGTFGGQRTTVERLFQDQITNYNQFTADVNL